MYTIPETLLEALGPTADGRSWLDQLPELIRDVVSAWELRLGAPMEAEASCSWVAPCETPRGEDAVLKLGYPHMEARDESLGLAFWDGDPTVRLLRADRAKNAMLLERCVPGTPLRDEPEEVQDEVIAGLLRRLWREPPPDEGFRPLADMIEYWARDASHDARDAELVAEALSVARELSASDVAPALLATDLHAGNVLRAKRLPWLAIDPKPFIGDRCYDGTQHLINCRRRMNREPIETVRRFGRLLELDEARFQRWAFVRFALHVGTDAQTTGRIAARLR